jgi:hypothetical protein
MHYISLIGMVCVAVASHGCVNNNSLVPTALWGGFFKNVSFVENGAAARSFPTSNAAIWMNTGFHGEPPSNGWSNSRFFGWWDNYGFLYAYNDSFPGKGQTKTCTLETVASVKNPSFFYKNIDISLADSLTGLTQSVDAPDTKLILTGIDFDAATPLVASDNFEPVDPKNINKTHAVKFLLSWSNDTLQGEFHWADITLMRPRPGLTF